MPEQLLCPGCGTPSFFDEIKRSANEFCRECDYPLFWARSSARVTRTGSPDDPEVRRLPGQARVAATIQSCWSCRRGNTIESVVCVHCGVDLSGPPPAVEAPPPVTVVEAPPPPPPPKASIWPWVLLLVLFVAGLVLLLVLL